jgi:hypothetical protein
MHRQKSSRRVMSLALVLLCSIGCGSAGSCLYARSTSSHANAYPTDSRAHSGGRLDALRESGGRVRDCSAAGPETD